MYQVGDRIVYGTVGVCEVKAVGPIEMQGARTGVDYYTLAPLYQGGTVFAPVDTGVYIRPVVTREETLRLIRQIPGIEADAFMSSNPRLLNEHYQVYLKSGDCTDLIRLIRTLYARGRQAAEKGRRLGQVDERAMRRAEELLHGEMACALGIRPEEVPDFITHMLEAEPAEA